MESTSSFGEIGIAPSAWNAWSREERPIREEMKKERLEYSFGLSFCRFTLFVFSVAVVASWLVFTGDEEEAFFMPLVARVVVGSTCVCEGASTHYAR